MASASGAPELGFTAVLLLLLLALQFGLQPFLTRSFVAKEVHPTSIVIIGEVSTCFTMCLKCCWSSSIIVPPNTRDVAVHSRPLDHTCRPTSCIECQIPCAGRANGTLTPFWQVTKFLLSAFMLIFVDGQLKESLRTWSLRGKRSYRHPRGGVSACSPLTLVVSQNTSQQASSAPASPPSFTRSRIFFSRLRMMC